MSKLYIDSERIAIRKLKLSDLNDFHAYRSNPEVTKYQGFDVYDLDKAKSFIEGQINIDFGAGGVWCQYGIENKATNRIIGDCAIKLTKDDLRIAEIGMTLSHLEQGKGYAKEALLAILAFLFNTKNVRRVEEIMDAENNGAINLLESIGFRREGHFIENIFFKGSWGSEYQYALLKREWEQLYKNK